MPKALPDVKLRLLGSMADEAIDMLDIAYQNHPFLEITIELK